MGTRGLRILILNLQAGPPAPTLTNEALDTVVNAGEIWQREFRDVSCRNQDNLGKPALTGCPEVV